jgi:hypothetical protein
MHNRIVQLRMKLGLSLDTSDIFEGISQRIDALLFVSKMMLSKIL